MSADLRALRRFRRALASAVVALAASAVPFAAPPAAAATPTWFKADLHVHSVLSADARPDLGIVAHNAAAAGYNAIFVTDHNLGSSFPINKLTANHLVLEDSYTRWAAGSGGSLTASTNGFVTSPVHSGTASLHLLASSASGGQTFASAVRGPSLRSGDAIVRFAVFPRRVDAGGSLYVSASIGGDPAIRGPVGYTTAAGVVSPAKSNVFVWYFGSPPPASLFPGSTVIATRLGSGSCDRAFATGVWIGCTVDLNSALPRLPAAAQPDPHDAWTDLKVAAAAANGTVEGFFDGYSIDASAPLAAGDEFVDRNKSLRVSSDGRWDGPGFHLFPSIELGVADHTQRFDYALSDPSKNLVYQLGIDGIPVTQASGYPAQLNHPGVNGGVTDQEAIDTGGEGADMIEVRQPGMVADWDAILTKGVSIVGTWGTDNHLASWGPRSQATIIDAPSLSFDVLMRSLFEGRVYLSTVGFAGHAVLGLACGASPYPARYPVFVSAQASTAGACLSLSGAATGSTVSWISGGATVATQAAAGTETASQPVALGGSSTYVRAELRDRTGALVAMTEPIMFRRVSGLPTGMTAHVDGVATPSGHGYAATTVRGLTQLSWAAATSALTLRLNDPAGSLVELEVGTAGRVPAGFSVAGTAVTAAASLTAFAAASGSAWFYDAAGHVLHLKASQPAGSTSAVVTFAAGG